MSESIRAHVERRTQGKYPAVPYLAVVSAGEPVGIFHDMEHAEIYQAGFNTGAEKQAERARSSVD